jgi:hypothetical protein
MYGRLQGVYGINNKYCVLDCWLLLPIVVELWRSPDASKTVRIELVVGSAGLQSREARLV